MTEPEASRNEELRAEVRWLYQALFSGPPSTVLETRYLEAHRHFCGHGQDRDLLKTIVEQRLDAEALELVLRRRQPELSRKCRIVFYLAETDPTRFARMAETTPHRIAAWPALMWAGLCTALKFAKGQWLVRRHHLA